MEKNTIIGEVENIINAKKIYKERLRERIVRVSVLRERVRVCVRVCVCVCVCV